MPVVMPLVRDIEIDPVHFGILMTLKLAISRKTPRMASGPITSGSVAQSGIRETSRTNLPYVGVLAFILLLTSCVREVSLALAQFVRWPSDYRLV